MAINLTYWGNPDTWTTDGAITYTQDLPTLVAESQIQNNSPIDTSITTVLADSGFYGALLNLSRNDAYLNNIYDIFDNKEDNLYNLSVYRSTDVVSVRPRNVSYDSWGKAVFADDAVTSEYQYFAPVTSFINKNIKLVIYVEFNDYLVGGEIRSSDLKTYFEKYYSTYKNILGIYAKPFELKNGVWTEINRLRCGIINKSDKINDFSFSSSEQFSRGFYSLTSWGGEHGFTIFGNLRDFAYSNIVSTYEDRAEVFYSYVVGYMPEITDEDEFDSDGWIKKRENGIKLFVQRVDERYDEYIIYRSLDLAITDYWGNDSTAFEEFCKKQVSYYGMFFVLSEDDLKKDYTDTNTFLGIIDENGITHGKYTHGSENSQQKNFDSDIINDIEKIRESENDRGDITSKTNNFIFTNANRLYILNPESLTQLMNFINIGYQPNVEQLTLDFKGKNPIDYITGCVIFPFEITSTVVTNLFIGGVPVKKSPYLENSENVAVKSVGLGNTYQQKIYDFGSVYIESQYNDFRDFEPFTKCEIQLPFCETYNVDLRKFINKNLGVKYIVDLQTGACTAYIFMNDLIIDSINGQIGYSINLSGIAQGDYQNTIQRNNFNLNTARLNLFSSAVGNINNAMTANPFSIANSVINSAQNIENYLNIDYQNKHFALSPTQISVADSLNGFYQDLQPRIIFYRCKTLKYNTDIYANTVGYACLKTGNLSDFSGYTKCSDVKININCTETEKQMIKNALLNGVYN